MKRILLVALWSGSILTGWTFAGEPEPGLLVRLYEARDEMQALPELAAGQLPNVVKIVPTLDLQLDRKDFDPLESRFLTEVVGRVEIKQAGSYNFRLISDDGAKLWIDGDLVVDHDGSHGATGKDGRVELTADGHDLRVRHFNGYGGAQLTLQWQPPDSPKDGFELVPAHALSHAADAPRATTPGPKRIIPPLRRGRPGDGTPVEGVHPSFTTFCAGPDLGEPKPAEAAPYENLQILANPGDNALGSALWLPPADAKARGLTTFYFADGPFKEQLAIAALGRPGLDRMFVEPAGVAYQGCVIRFTQGVAGDVKSFALTPDGAILMELLPPKGAPSDATPRRQVLTRSEKTAFEMRAVRAMTNGLEIEFTKPLDPRMGWEPESYQVEAWPFDTEKGVPPTRDGSLTRVKSATVQPERTLVFLEIDELRPSTMYYVRLLPPCAAEDGERPWTTEAWYTLNTVPPHLEATVLKPPPPEPANFLMEEEQQAGWRLLFDGQTVAGWHTFGKHEIPEGGWQAIKGCLVRVGPGGDISTDEEFDDFELQLEWRISAGGNSGIFFRSSEEFKWAWETAPEMQVLDNAEHADGKNPKTSAGSNYALHAPSQDITQPVGLFNKVRIVAQGPHVEYWLNGVKIVEYELGSPTWVRMVTESKFKEMPNYGRRAKGHIVLQDHGDKVWYRNIKIRRLAAE